MVPASQRSLVSLLSLLASITLLTLCACDESPTSRPPVSGQPELLASWGHYDRRDFDEVPGDILLTREDRRLYIVRRFSTSTAVTVLDRQTGQSDQWTPVAGDGVAPTAIDGTASGDVLAVLYARERVVGIFSGDHVLLDHWELPHAEHRHLQIDVALDAATGTVAVADGANGQLYVFRLDGSLIADVGLGIDRPTSAFGVLRIAALGTGGFLLTSEIDNQNRLRRLGPDGSDRGGWTGVDPGRSAVVAVGGDGNIYLSDVSSQRIQRYSPDGALLGQTAFRGFDRWMFAIVALDATVGGEVLFGDASYPAVHEYSATGDFQHTRFLQTPDPDLVMRVTDLAVGAGGTIIAVDEELRRGTVALPGTGVLRTFGEPGTAEDPLVSPSAVLAAQDGSVYVVDSSLDQLRNYSIEGHLNHIQPGFTGLRLAAGTDWMYTSSPYESIRRRRADAPPGSSWERLALSGVPHGTLRYIKDIDVGPDGTLYILAGAPNSILRLDPDGRFLALQLLDTPVDPTSPDRLVVDSAGRTHVTGFDGEYVLYDRGGELVAWWNDDEYGQSAAIAVDDGGRIYLATYYRDIRQLAPIP